MNEEPFADVTNDSAASSATRKAFKDLADAAKKACEAGKADARHAAENAVPILKKEAEKAVHDIAFGVGYLSTFAGTLLTELAPEVVKSGAAEGAESGRKAAENCAAKTKERAASAEKSDTVVDIHIEGPEPSGA